jgi:uncharacterized cupredoxin-like copper-binding protein
MLDRLPSIRVLGNECKELEMSTSIEDDTGHTADELAGELHDLEVQEAALERRTRSLELSGPLALLFSLIALAVGVGALVVSLTSDSDNAVRSVASSGGVTSSAGGTTSGSMMGGTAAHGPKASAMMMGAGGHGSFTSAQVSAAKAGTVYVQLGDIWVAPTVPSVHAGKVTFKAKNVGRLQHELMVERMPMKMDGPMQPNEDAAQGMIPDMNGGGSGQMTMHLRPGMYTLFCNVEGHYAAGQHITFNVTKA